MLAESVPGESAAKARKYFLRNMENRLTEGSRKFLKALGEVDSVRSLFLSLSLIIFYHTTISSVRPTDSCGGYKSRKL